MPSAPSHFVMRLASCSLALALSGLAACSRGGDGGSGSPAGGDVGGTMVVVQPEPETLFPATTTGNQAYPIIGSIFDRLAEIGPALDVTDDASFQPRLATGWQWAPDSLSIAFALDPRARWHDGARLRAEDVRYSFAVYTSDTVGSSSRSLLGNIDSVQVRDSLTAVFWFKRRLPHQLFDATYHMYILPSHLLSSTPMSALAAAPFGSAPVGTGRFRFAQWEKGARLEMIADTANPRGRAKLDRVIFMFASDFGTATVKLFTGDADFYEGIKADNLPQVANARTLRLEDYPALKYEYMGYNLRARGDRAQSHPILGDPAVRRALAMAVDRERLARNVLDTLGAPVLSAAPRVLIPDTTGLRPITYNRDAATALLDSLGWTVNPATQVRERNGVRFTLELLSTGSTPVRQRAAVLLQQQLGAIGVEIKPVTLEPRALGARVTSGDYDAFMGGWAMTPGRLGMVQTWRSTGESNYGRYASPEFDRLLDSAITSTNPRGRAERWTAVFQRLNDDQPALWLYEAVQPVAIHTRIRNTPLRADGWYAGLADWSVDPAQRIDRDRIGIRGTR